MRSKRMVYWALGIPLLLIFLIIIIVKLDTSDNSISRAMASKAMALALTDRENCTALQKERGSHFAAGEEGEWYTKYIDYLLEEGLLSLSEGESADKDYAAEALTYGEAAAAAEKISPGLSQSLNISVKKYGKAMPKEEWWLFYTSLLKAADPEKNVKEENLFLYGTPQNVKEAAPWTAYTSLGTMGFEGLSLDSYIDHELKMIYRGGELICLSSIVSDKVVYRNVWVVPGEENRVNLHIGTIVRDFKAPAELEEETEGFLADVTLDGGKVKKFSVKRDTIEGKVLAVREDSIEIEGYGTLRLDDDFKVYKTYGVVKEQKRKDILVGYDLGKFVVAGKKVCAALLSRSFSAKNIRVLVMNSDFSSIFHSSVTLCSDSDLVLEYGEDGENDGSREILAAGTELVLTPSDSRLEKGRLKVEPVDLQKEITVKSITRSQGTPSYFGSFEVSCEPEGLILLNDVDVEDYLTRVVPSEMPPSYELEALKAQAVCARTYAYRQIQANAYSQYGAHVDDSTNYQVYNNIESSDRTDLAIKETDGQMVFCGGEPVDTYYFSTSCGYSTDGTIWGAAQEDVPYLKGACLLEQESAGEDNSAEAMTDNEKFTAFIQGDGDGGYESSFAMYRWKTTITDKMLAEKVDGIGNIRAIFVTERGVGGIAKTVKIVGSEGEKTLNGQTQIRNTLGGSQLVYTRKDGSTMTDWSSLPSAFIAVDETARDEESGTRTFTIWGGGYGHGVGLSQNGAQAMAKAGKSYLDILTFFYSGVEVKEIESES